MNWISVKNLSLPIPLDTEVLVIDMCGNIFLGKFREDFKYDDDINTATILEFMPKPCTCCFSGNHYLDGFTHWMPLPSKPGEINESL